jgi:hypothetical protein
MDTQKDFWTFWIKDGEKPYTLLPNRETYEKIMRDRAGIIRYSTQRPIDEFIGPNMKFRAIQGLPNISDYSNDPEFVNALVSSNIYLKEDRED